VRHIVVSSPTIRLTGEMSGSLRRVTSAAVLLVGSLLLASCAQPVEVVEDAVEVAKAPAPEPDVIEEPRIPPTWEQSVSTADFARCKLRDPRPDSERDLGRGQKRGDVVGRENVGFPRSEKEIPGLGVGNIILAKVAFDDAPPSGDIPDDFLETQAAFMTEWSEFFSQGNFRYEFQVVPGWVEVPINHAEYEIDPGAGDNEYDQDAFQRLVQGRMETIIQKVINELPADLDYSAADTIFLYWTPEMYAFKQTVSRRDTVFQTPQGPIRISVQGGGTYHTTDTGGVTAEMKREFAWSYFLHDIMHWQGMNGHAPGNGWKTGIGQGAYPVGSGEYSGVIAAWEAFLFEWYEDSQVHCADIETLSEPERVMLTPIEVYGGDRKMIAIRTVDYKVLAVESRRPIGYSKWWFPENSGLLVYELDADGIQMDHLPDDCGNDPAMPKWAYYVYPDGAEVSECIDNDVSGVIVKEGMSVTHSGVKISLEFSDDEMDYVLIERVADD
jgi:hypothetical protein